MARVRHTITKQLVKQICAYGAGRTFTEIRKKFGHLSDSTIWRILVENKVEWKHTRRTGRFKSKHKKKNRKEGVEFFNEHERENWLV